MQQDDLVTINGIRLGSLRERVEHDPRWKCSGWRVFIIYTTFGDGRGMTQFVPDHMLEPAPTEWTPVIGCRLEARWEPCVNDNGITTGQWRRNYRRIPEAVASDS
jgi:hypothetical protein